MESLCGSHFWESSVNVSKHQVDDKQHPASHHYVDFSACFHMTLLRWAPCAILWVVAPCWLYMLRKPATYKVKTSWLLLCKTLAILGLMAIEAFNFARAAELSRAPVYYVTPTITVFTYILALTIIHLEKAKGLPSSTLLFVFWAFFTLLMSISLRKAIIDFWIKKVSALPDLVSFLAFYSLLIVNLVISVFSEKSTRVYDRSKEKMDEEGPLCTEKPKLEPMPENQAPLLSRLSFWWINDLIIRGYKKPLTREDLWQVDEQESSEILTERLETTWNALSKDYFEAFKARPDLFSVSNDGGAKGKKRKIFRKKEPVNHEEQVELTQQPDVMVRTPKKPKKPSLTVCLIKTFGGKFFAGAFIKVIQDCMLFVGPLILDKLITFVKSSNDNGENSDASVGYFYTGLLFITALIQSFALQHYFHRMFIVGARVRTSVMNLIYKKSIKLSTSARRTATVGEMTNLMSVNAQMLADLTTYLNVIWSSPFQIIIALVLLYQYLGVSALIGVGTVLILIPLNIYVSNRIKSVQLTKQKQQDSRIKMMNEILSGIKVLKFYGWELSFKDIVGQIRSTEMKYYKRIGLLSILANFLWMCAPLIITIVSFGCFLFLNDNSKFTANVVFVSLSLFNILRFPLIVLPSIISAIISAQVSLKRISSFLLKDEIDENDISHDDLPGVAVKVENADLGWSHDETFIRGLDLEVKKGKLVAIVGPVGSGKSSLVSGLLGEMHKLNDGLININGQTAYVPQQAWIQNQTLKNNIIFRLNRRVNEEKYQRVIEACSLTTDLLIMPAGDKTEIGEKGINLSGGQKQRISLARAVYSDADIYMLDDPLSAVDSHVGKHIFDHVIGPNGMLRDKTRILVTNALSFLPQCDEIILLDNGRIIEIGSYDQLVSKKEGRFNYFIKSYLENENKTDDEEIDEQELPAISDIQPSSSTGTPNNQSIRRKSRASPELKEAKKEDPKEKAGEKIIQKEKIETGKIKLSVLMAYFRACRLHYFAIFVFLFSIANIASVGSNWWLSAWTDSSKENLNSTFHKGIDAISKRVSTSHPALFPFLIFCLIGFLQCALTLISDTLFLFMSVYAANRLHDSMLFSILRSTLQFFESTPSGRIINRFSKDIDAAERSIPDSFKALMRCIYQVMFTVLVITFSTPWFLVAFVPIVIIYSFIQRYFVASMRQLKRLDSASKSPIFSHFSETLTGVTTIRAYKMEKNFTRHMEYLVDENLLYYFPNNVSNRWLAIRLELIGNLIAVFAALFAVISRNSLSPSLVGLSISYALNVSQTLNWFVRMSAEFETNVTSVERIQEYCETPHEKEWYIESTKPDDKWPSQGKIEFNNYSVRYREELENVLRAINMKINPGEKIGIVGRTGAGKSSLALGLFRLLELSDGTIEIDGINIKELGLHDLRHKLTIIPQDPVIFSGTIRMNLDPFGSHSNEDIWRSLELVDLKPFVTGLEKQLDYECSEGGENLSVGQRQLICLARALLRKSKILILDEATASIDHNTDELIQKTIRTQFDDCTVLTVAHRLNTILDSSRILVLDKGTIAEFDTPQNLLKNKNSRFYSMAKDAGLI